MPAGLTEEVAPTAAVSDYVRVKRKHTTIFLYAELATDTVHDLRVRRACRGAARRARFARRADTSAPRTLRRPR